MRSPSDCALRGWSDAFPAARAAPGPCRAMPRLRGGTERLNPEATKFEQPSSWTLWEDLMSALDANVDVPMTAEGDFASTIQTGEFLVNLDTRVVLVDSKRVHLTGKEYGILELLSLRKGSTVTKEMFLNHLYAGMDEPEIKIIDVFVCKLRKKLAQATGGKHYIETVWGRGYVLRDPTAIPAETNVVGPEYLG